MSKNRSAVVLYALTMGWVLAVLFLEAGLFTNWLPEGKFIPHLCHAVLGLGCVLLFFFTQKLGKKNTRLRYAKWIATLLLWILVISAFNLTQGQRLQKFVRDGWFHSWNIFHYYLGSKYFNELGYHDLYEQVIVADREGPNRLKEIELIRSLDNYEFVEIASLDLRRSDRFTDARWEAFKRDSAYINKKTRKKELGMLIGDRGYNPTPFWNTVGSAFTNALDITVPRQRALLISTDLALGLLAVGLSIWAFGPFFTGVLLLAFFLAPMNAGGGRIVGKILGYDWFYTMLMGFALFHKRRYTLSGISWSYAIMTRIFPLILVFGLFISAVFELFKSRKIAPENRKFFTAMILSCGLFFMLGCLNSYGFGSWQNFKSNISLHRKHHVGGAQRAGLKHFFTHKLGEKSFESDFNSVHFYESQKTEYAIVAITLLLMVGWLLPKKKGYHAMIWALPILFALLVTSRYYWSVLFFLPLLDVPNDYEKKSRISASVITLLFLTSWFYFMHTTYHNNPWPIRNYTWYIYFNGVLALVFFAMMVAEIARGAFRFLNAKN